MSWIRSEKALLHHPKTAHLKVLLNVETATVIGRLHMLWWWCLDYALDGDLSRKEPKVIENSCEIPLKVLIKSGFVDKKPYIRIHDWWANQGNYLKIRFRDHPEFWSRIRDSYVNNSPMGKNMGKTVGKTMDVDLRRSDVANVRTDVEVKAREAAALGATPPALPALKSFEEAGEDEICAPPKNFSKILANPNK